MSTCQQLPAHPHSGTSTRSSPGENTQHQGGTGMGFVQMVGFCLVLHLWPVMERGWEKSKEEETGGKGAGWDGDAALCLPVWFPSKLVQGCPGGCSSCTSALPPHAVLLPKGLWAGAERGAQHPAPPPASSLPRLLPCFPWCGRIRPYPGMAAPALGTWASVGGKGGCVWEGLLLIMCTLGRAGLVVGAQDWTREPQVPQPAAGHIIPACLRFPRSWRHKWLSCQPHWDFVGLRELAV